jgi:hypothetical protein
MKRRALPHFLGAANDIPGILITVGVSKRHPSLFRREGRIDMTEDELRPYQQWERDTFEKLLRAVHFLSFFLAGLSANDQSFMWYSDDDDIAPNSGETDRSRTLELGEIWRNVITHYVPHHVPQITIGTEKDDDPSKSLSDLLAIPDLACGAWCRLLSHVTGAEFLNAKPALTAALPALPQHVLSLLSWFAEAQHSLKRLLVVIDEPLPNGGVSYMSSAPPLLEGFKRAVEACIKRDAA